MSYTKETFVNNYNSGTLVDKDGFGWTPIIYAAFYNKYEILEDLLQTQKYSIDAVNCHGRSALMMAAKNNCINALEILIRHGAQLDLRDEMGATALFFAVRMNSIECVKMLIQAGLDVNICDKTGNSAVFSAARLNNVECVSLLINHGANVQHVDHFGMSVLDYVDIANTAIDGPGRYDEVKKLLLQNKGE